MRITEGGAGNAIGTFPIKWLEIAIDDLARFGLSFRTKIAKSLVDISRA
jgi:hypothetical protein